MTSEKNAPRTPYYEIRRSPIQGKGAFALRTIRKGTRIVEYIGERISSAEANRRYDDDAMKRHHTFLFALDGRTCIDAAHFGNDARFINHSCEPNCEAILEDGRIFIFATKTIREGLELTYDYQYIVAGPIDEETRRMYVCRCGAPTCRGSILKAKPQKKPRKQPRTSAPPAEKRPRKVA